MESGVPVCVLYGPAALQELSDLVISWHVPDLMGSTGITADGSWKNRKMSLENSSSLGKFLHPIRRTIMCGLTVNGLSRRMASGRKRCSLSRSADSFREVLLLICCRSFCRQTSATTAHGTNDISSSRRPLALQRRSLSERRSVLPCVAHCAQFLCRFTMEKIATVPVNEAAWNYFKG